MQLPKTSPSGRRDALAALSHRLLVALAFCTVFVSSAVMAESLPEQCEQFYSAAQNQEALSVCRAAAEAGHCESQANLAWLYVWGLDTKDPASGFSWMTRAAQCGSARAKSNLGVLYREGIGTPASNTEAVRWLRSAVSLPSGRYSL